MYLWLVGCPRRIGRSDEMSQFAAFMCGFMLGGLFGAGLVAFFAGRRP